MKYLQGYLGRSNKISRGSRADLSFLSVFGAAARLPHYCPGSAFAVVPGLGVPAALGVLEHTGLVG